MLWVGLGLAAILAICGVGVIIEGRGIVHDLEDMADDE